MSAQVDISAAMTYESAVTELEKIVGTMEEGKLPLEQSLESYRRGMELLRFCRERLRDAEQRVRILDDGVLRDLPDQDDRT